MRRVIDDVASMSGALSPAASVRAFSSLPPMLLYRNTTPGFAMRSRVRECLLTCSCSAHNDHVTSLSVRKTLDELSAIECRYATSHAHVMCDLVSIDVTDHALEVGRQHKL